MEVLKTGEELERQILEDARKKASRTLEAADKECQKARVELMQALEAEYARIDADGERRIAALRAQLESQLPMDFQRIRLAWVDEAVTGSLRELLARLTQEELGQILGARLREAAGVFAGKPVKVFYAGLDLAVARSTVEEAMPAACIVSLEPRKAASASPPASGLVVESADAKLRYRCTLAELESLLLENHREELAVTLLGREELEASPTVDTRRPVDPAKRVIDG